MRIFGISLLMASGSLLVPASAALLNVQNASFEIATLPATFPQGNANNLVPGGGAVPFGGTLANWTPINTTTGNNIGAYDPNPGGPNWTFVWETGNNVGYAQSFGASALDAGLRQLLSDTLQANTTYTLQVDVGRRTFSLPWTYTVELWAGGQQLGSASTLALSPNQAGTETLTVNIGGSHAQLGQLLEIRLMTNGNSTEAFFDNVRLDGSSTVPEPATYAMVLAGAGALWLRRRTR